MCHGAVCDHLAEFDRGGSDGCTFGVVCEFFGSEVTLDLEPFKRRSDHVVANCWSDELADVRGAVVADYQNVLEEAWVAELRKKFDVKINWKELNKLR